MKINETDIYFTYRLYITYFIMLFIMYHVSFIYEFWISFKSEITTSLYSILNFIQLIKEL